MLSKVKRLGIGTFMMKPPEAALDYAISHGYQLVDTANAYFNEKAVGSAIKKSNVAREDIFLSTKLWPTVYSKPSAIDETFERLQVDYVDLLFLHHPAAFKSLSKCSPSKLEILIALILFCL